MAETFLALFAAHLAGDFILQPRRLLDHKRNPLVLLLHVGLVTLTSAVLLGGWHVPVLSVIFITHLLMDAVKVYLLPKTTASFLLDQAVHVLVIAALAITYAPAFNDGTWPALLGDSQDLFLRLLALASGLIASVLVGGILIDMATRNLIAQLPDDAQGLKYGLKNGGRYIGWLERALIMLLYLIGEPSGIGFLLTAKSILRFGEVKESSQRKAAEYIIIGTLMSFGWALLVAVLTARGMALWPM
ncbi:MAG: DUF3307 domain-containing protein [Gammaproteobacteria bacterium]